MDNDYDMDEDEDGYSYDLVLQRKERERYRREEEQEMEKTKATYSDDDEYDDLYSTPSRPKISKTFWMILKTLMEVNQKISIQMKIMKCKTSVS